MLKSMDMEPISELNDMGRATITELANMVTGQAVTKLENLGFKFDLTPPALVTGDNMEISNQNVEALIVPIQVPQGKIEINVAIRERG
jgi:chemotaxis protein CheX